MNLPRIWHEYHIVKYANLNVFKGTYHESAMKLQFYGGEIIINGYSSRQNESQMKSAMNSAMFAFEQ